MNMSAMLERKPDPQTLLEWLDKIPYARYLGMRAQLRGEEILFVLPPDEKLIGNSSLPAIHGGVVGAFMEQAGVFELIAHMEKPVLPKVIDFSLDYLRPTRLQDTFAACEVTRQGRFVANVCIKAWQDDIDKPCAIARAHFLIAEDA
jgi:uncharacterized protein (TIGR00369 family)